MRHSNKVIRMPILIISQLTCQMQIKPGGTHKYLTQTPRLSGAKYAMRLPLVRHTGKQILDRVIDPSARGGALLHSDSQSSWIGTGQRGFLCMPELSDTSCVFTYG